MTKKRRSHTHQSTSRQLRIIAGQWRGRKLTFTDSEGLRPTSDRVRETLFNWLSTTVPAAYCLDLFAGSGALGLEALSRGAQHVDFVDTAPRVIEQLHHQLHLLKANNANVCQDQADLWLSRFERKQHTPYDIVFIDPPFRMGLVEHCVNIIHERQVLAQKAWVYLEMGIDEFLPILPNHWKVHREKTAGQVCYRLIATG